jgi:hypothetical protein
MDEQQASDHRDRNRGDSPPQAVHASRQRTDPFNPRRGQGFRLGRTIDHGAQAVLGTWEAARESGNLGKRLH